VGKQRGVRWPIIRSCGGAGGDSLQRGNGGLRTNTTGTPSDEGNLWSLHEPYGVEEGEVSTVAGGTGKGSGVAALPAWRRHLRTKAAEQAIRAWRSNKDVVSQHLYTGARTTDSAALLGQSTNGMLRLSR
jgi:hypothetical protein